MLFIRNVTDRLQAALGHPEAQFAHGCRLADLGDYRGAFLWFAKAARAGLPAAQHRLGQCYMGGRGVTPSIQETLRWLTRAADAGETAAQAQLASLALIGIRDPQSGGLFGLAEAQRDAPDYDTAERWARPAAAAGSAEAKALLAFILTAGPQARRDAEAGRTLYRESADAGWGRGQLARAMILLCDGGREAASAAEALLHLAAGSDVAGAHFLLGLLEESGAGGKADWGAAAESYRLAAEKGHATAQLRYGLALLAGRGVNADAFTAETWLRRAASGGEAQAAAAIGDLYAQQDGKVPANYAEAAVWYQRAAEAGHGGAARMLGRLYLRGQGVRKHVADGAHWLRIAIERGDDAARDDMARLSLERQVSETDQRETASWFARQAEAGNPAAQFNYGLCLAEGIGVARDAVAALTWFDRSAETMPAARLWQRHLRTEGCVPVEAAE